MNDFKWKHFRGEIILGCVRWYCKYGISYRDQVEMMVERGVEVDHSTLFRWVQQYAPEIEKRMRWYNGSGLSESWQVDETYVKVKGKWNTSIEQSQKVERHLISTFLTFEIRKLPSGSLEKILRRMKEYEKPVTVNTDKAPSYVGAIRELKERSA